MPPVDEVDRTAAEGTPGPGESQIFRRGDIHQTLSMQPDTARLRLTRHDLREEKAAGRLVRYEDDVGWPGE